MKALRVENLPKRNNPIMEPQLDGEREVLTERAFKRMIAVERKRSERSQEPFLLMLVELGDRKGQERRQLEDMICVLRASSRETDVIGWYKDQSVVGVLFTGLVINDRNLILKTILTRVSSMLRDELTFDQFNQVSLSFHFFPEEWDLEGGEQATNVALYSDILTPPRRKRSLLAVKRALDVVASALGLLLLSPLFLLIAVAIKLTSRGPVLFRQQRVGQYGNLFTVLKFRSMYVNDERATQQDNFTRLIVDNTSGKDANCAPHGACRMTNDRRITPLGRILRRASLDDLPQIFNVLSGEMSLVGPRPPIPYELAAYQTWHRRRILEAKPGITGLWQVSSRSLVNFDDMVRLDLRYATSWSIWLDLWILLRTPVALIRGTGSY